MAQAGDVRAFQAAHGLASDGVIGPETRFALAAGGPGPRLLRELD
jgi:peptidoglycan hydrolase-like protein with peptidoglycan-binding domain